MNEALIFSVRINGSQSWRNFPVDPHHLVMKERGDVKILLQDLFSDEGKKNMLHTHDTQMLACLFLSLSQNISSPLIGTAAAFFKSLLWKSTLTWLRQAVNTEML